ncbi:MAG: hypothetical protein Q9190_002634 [Brigantiaea leucoxantha]
MADSTTSYTYPDLPPLPEYQVHLLPPLIAPIPDKLLTLLLPIAAYWALSMFFHWIDVNDYFPQYRLHTPAEVASRNKVSRWEVIRDVVIQQVVQTVVGTLLGMTEPDDVYGKEEYDVAVWARRIRCAQRAMPGLLGLVGINAQGLAKNLNPAHPMIAGAIMGGHYPLFTTFEDEDYKSLTTGFVAWERFLANAIYWFAIPLLQFAIGIIVVDTWQYFLHRAMHMNKWLYTTFHSRHHRLYVPYAYGALYNHPFEGFLLDTLGASVAYKIAGMNTRQGMLFFTGSTFKTVDDHCGYSLPWDPLQRLTSNNAGYHDVHHQSWGIKTNFSQPFFTFWDRLLGTVWTGGDVSARYEKARLAAARKDNLKNTTPTVTGSDIAQSTIQSLHPYEFERSNAKDLASIPSEYQDPKPPLGGKAELQAVGSRQQILDDTAYGGPSVLAQEAAEEKEARSVLRTTAKSRRRTANSLSQKDGLKGLKDRVAVAGSIHGRAGGIIGVDSSR